ncbi:MAG: hypothetical protein Q3966_04270, partial [Neisseria sp.]|nr:hypothetical protein [Neisseria sp.]
YYRRLGRHRDLNHTQDELIPPRGWKDWCRTDFFVFYNENQSCCQWGVRRQDWHLPDPPVWQADRGVLLGEECPGVSAFLHAMGCIAAVFSLPYGSGEFSWPNQDGLDLLKRSFPIRPFALNLWLDGGAFYGGGRDIIMLTGTSGAQAGLCYASGTQEGFDALDEVLGGFEG